MQKKSCLELNAQNHFVRASKEHTILCLGATKQINEKCEATDAQKLISQSEKLLMNESY